MQVEQLAVPDAFLLTPAVHADGRGTFREQYRADALREVLGHVPQVAQVNASTSRRGVLRGLHFADVGPGQAKYVWCARGAVLDVAVDLRTGSPAYGRSAAVRLDDETGCAVYLAEGLGHAFLALTDEAVVHYLCSTPYDPGAEHTVDPRDPALALPWPRDVPPVLSERDAAAPPLAQAEQAGLLPTYAACQQRYADLRAADRRSAAGGSGQ